MELFPRTEFHFVTAAIVIRYRRLHVCGPQIQKIHTVRVRIDEHGFAKASHFVHGLLVLQPFFWLHSCRDNFKHATAMQEPEERL